MVIVGFGMVGEKEDLLIVETKGLFPSLGPEVVPPGHCGKDKLIDRRRQPARDPVAGAGGGFPPIKKPPPPPGAPHPPPPRRRGTHIAAPPPPRRGAWRGGHVMIS